MGFTCSSVVTTAGICSKQACNVIFLQMTGRKGRVVRRPDGSVRYESRAEQGLTIDHINIKEKDRFMSGEKVQYTYIHTYSHIYI